jgi:ribonuclease P protein component
VVITNPKKDSPEYSDRLQLAGRVATFEVWVQRKFRLTRSEDFKRVRRTGKSFAHPLAVLVAQHSQNPQVRVGVSAGKTTGSAVHRNRARRLLREAMRPFLPLLAPHWDLVLIARPALAAANLEQARAAVHSLLLRAELIPVINEF